MKPRKDNFRIGYAPHGVYALMKKKKGIAVDSWVPVGYYDTKEEVEAAKAAAIEKDLLEENDAK